MGTAAAEGFPGVFCRCKHCKKARELGGKNIRTRSSVIIDDVLKVDLPPDTYHHVLRDRIDLATVKDLLITHTHSDHLYANELNMRVSGYAHGCDHPLNIYGSETSVRLIREKIGKDNEYLQLHLLQPFVTIEIETARVTPLLADHGRNETCLLFFIERKGKTLLYGHDTGWFPRETWEWLENNRIDLAILDCTNGHIPSRKGHMNIEAVLEIDHIFREKAIYHGDSKTIATHFSHNIGLLHEDLIACFQPHGIEVAYDGMIYTLV